MFREFIHWSFTYHPILSVIGLWVVAICVYQLWRAVAKK